MPVYLCADRTLVAEQQSANEELFYVERIIARSIYTYPSHTRGRGPEHHYLVRWYGYSPADDSWEPASELANTAKDLVESFDEDGELSDTYIGRKA